MGPYADYILKIHNVLCCDHCVYTHSLLVYYNLHSASMFGYCYSRNKGLLFASMHAISAKVAQFKH